MVKKSCSKNNINRGIYTDSNTRSDKVIVEKYSALYEACSKYPKVQLCTFPRQKSIFDTNPENFVDKIAEDGFIEKFALDNETRQKVKRLRLDRK